jgi:hypothetical protein
MSLTNNNGFWIVWLDLLIPYTISIADLHNLEFTVTHALRFSVFTSRLLVPELKQSHCEWIFWSHTKFLLQLLSSLGYLLPTTDSILILPLSVVRRCIPILFTLTLPHQFSYNFWTPNLNSLIPPDKSESESYITTDGRSASLYYCQTAASLLMWGALSDKRMGLSFTIATGHRQRSHVGVRVPWSITESTRMKSESIVGRRWPRKVSSWRRLRSQPVKT